MRQRSARLAAIANREQMPCESAGPTVQRSKTQVVVLTADAAFEEQARATFGASAQIELRVVSGTLAAIDEGFELEGATVVVIDLDAGQPDEMQALERLMARIGAWPPVVVVTQAFDAERRAHAAADAGRRFPGEAGARRSSWCATCARVAKGAGDRRDRPRRRSTPSCRRSAAPA